MLKDRQLILAKAQPTVDVDPVPTPEANALVTSDMEFSLVARPIERPQALQWMGQKPPLNIGDGLKIRFKTEVRGNGTVGGAPEVDPLLKACNYTATEDPGVKWTYALNSLVANEESSGMVTIYFYQDKIWHSIVNARGTVKTAMKSGDYVFDEWEFTGIYAAAARVGSMPAGTFASTPMPPRFTSALLTIGGYTPILDNLSLDLANKVVMRKDANAATGIREWMITDREPKGSLDPEIPNLVAATLSTDLAGDNNDLVFTSHATNYPGIDGNDISVEYEDTGTAGAETVVVTTHAIVVGIEAGVSTAAQVKTAVEASAEAMALLASVANKAANDGSGTVAVLAHTHLSGGTGLDFWKKWADSTGLALSATVGQTAGNRCVFSSASAVLDAPTYADRENMLTHSLNFKLCPVAGNDELTRVYS